MDRPQAYVTNLELRESNPDEILSYVRERNRTAGITIHAIGLSGAQDAYLMRSLAEQNGGQYVAQ